MFGNLYLTNKVRSEEFTPADKEVLISLATAAGVAIHNARLYEQAQRSSAWREVDLAVDDLDGTIRELRSTIYGLQAPLNDRPSLRARLLEVLDAGTEQLGFVPAMRLDGLLDTTATPDVAEHVLATVREALSNVARHAGASRVELLVAARDHTLQVVVEDDGVGVSADAARSGLRNLASRAEQLGGSLHVGAGETLGGTRLTWQVPI